MNDECKNLQLEFMEGALKIFSEAAMRGMRQVSNIGSGQVMQYSMCRAMFMVSTLVPRSSGRISAHPFTSVFGRADLWIVWCHYRDTAGLEDGHCCALTVLVSLCKVMRDDR